MISKLLPEIPLHTKNEWILGKHRAQWVVHAAKAIIGATDAHLRWLVLQAGEAEFIRTGATFKHFEPAIAFTEDELRWMFKCIEASVPARFRATDIAGNIAQFQRRVITDAELKDDGDPGGTTGHDGPTHQMGDGVTVETLPDRDKANLVH